MKKYLQNITTGVVGDAPLKRQSCFDKRGFVSQEKGPEMRSFFFERISAKYGILDGLYFTAASCKGQNTSVKCGTSVFCATKDVTCNLLKLSVFYVFP